MSLFNKALEKEKSSLGFKSLRRVIKESPIQNGGTTKYRDIVRKAIASGKRRSATGKIYYEYRLNRTDKKGTNL